MSATTIDVQRPALSAIDEFLPVYDISDAVALLVAADLATTWEALLDADLIAVGRRRPAVAALGALRMAPDLLSRMLHGGKPRAPDRMRVRDMPELDMADGGWLLLAERPGQEIALGLVGKFWRPVIQFAELDAARFRDFDVPGYAKTVFALSVRPVDAKHTLLASVMRTATTDECARAWFRHYWTFGIGSGAHVLGRALLDCVRADAELGIARAGHGQCDEAGIVPDGGWRARAKRLRRAGTRWGGANESRVVPEAGSDTRRPA